MPAPNGDDDPREAREARQRPPETYATISEWWADYHGFVPLAMAHGISQLMRRTGMDFGDAYLKLLGAGAIVELEPLRPRRSAGPGASSGGLSKRPSAQTGTDACRTVNGS